LGTIGVTPFTRVREGADDEKVDPMINDDYPDDDVLAREQPPFEEKLDHNEGVLEEPDAHVVGTGHGGPEAAPDDYSSDPFADGANEPGTVDDIPLTFGQQLPDSADAHLVPEGSTRQEGRSSGEASDAADVGKADEDELWRAQKDLVEEDEKQGLKLDGFAEEEIPEILDAMGDDAAEPLGDFPNGTSATGDWTAPEHGGFPERTD
jgi:hypothetical protein